MKSDMRMRRGRRTRADARVQGCEIRLDRRLVVNRKMVLFGGDMGRGYKHCPLPVAARRAGEITRQGSGG